MGMSGVYEPAINSSNIGRSFFTNGAPSQSQFPTTESVLNGEVKCLQQLAAITEKVSLNPNNGIGFRALIQCIQTITATCGVALEEDQRPGLSNR